MPRVHLSALLGAGWLLVPGAPLAQAAAPPISIVFSPCSTTDSAQEARDAALVKAAVQRFAASGFSALAKDIPTLETVMTHAPASGGRLEDCPTEVVVRSANVAEFLVDSLAASRAEGAGGKSKPANWRQNPYARAAFYIGSYNVEAGDSTKALSYLERGLAIDPAESQLTTEAANTLSHLHRSEEALRLVEAALGSGRLYPAPDRARLLRAKGYALGEMTRYEDAEAAYRESLKLQPGHVGAQNELIYLARMKAGANPTPSILMTGTQAATTSADAVLAEKQKAAAGAPKP